MRPAHYTKVVSGSIFGKWLICIIVVYVCLFRMYADTNAATVVVCRFERTLMSGNYVHLQIVTLNHC